MAKGGGAKVGGAKVGVVMARLFSTAGMVCMCQRGRKGEMTRIAGLPTHVNPHCTVSLCLHPRSSSVAIPVHVHKATML